MVTSHKSHFESMIRRQIGKTCAWVFLITLVKHDRRQNCMYVSIENVLWMAVQTYLNPISWTRYKLKIVG